IAEHHRARQSLMTETPVRPSGLCSIVVFRDRCSRILLVGHMLAPMHGGVLIVDLVDREVDHQSVGGGPVPVVLVGFEEDAIAGTDELDRPAAALAEPNSLSDEDGLPERVGVPRRAGA